MPDVEPLPRSLLHPRHWLTWLGIGLLRVSLYLPRSLRLVMGRGLGRLLWHSSARRQQIAATNLQWCFPEWNEAQRTQVLRAHFRIMGQCFIDYPLLWFGSAHEHQRRIQLIDEAGVLQEDFPRPVIVCAGHAPALDFGGLRISQQWGGVSFAKPMKNPVVDWINTRSRSQYGALMFAREQGLRPVLRAIRAGRDFYYLADEDLGPRNTIFAPFFGIKKATVPALGRLAQISSARVIPAMGIYDADKDQYALVLAKPLKDFPQGEEMADTTQMNQALEALIRRYPEQYLWTQKLFKTRPEGEAPPY